MNWTGGKLQRSKQANKGIAQIQKAHFARARTQLQNNSNALPTPLPSSFFREEGTLGSQLPPFTAHTVRRVGHSRTLLHGSADEASPARAHTSMEQYERRPLFTSDESRRKPKAKNADPEESLLEARRRRLLRQQDWAGLTHSKPPALRFPSHSEKDKIGKRRKVKGRDALTRALKGDARFPARQLQNEQTGPYMSGALPVEDVSIRIGTNALSDLAPTQQTPEAPQRAASLSDVSSDTMLFDYENPRICAYPGPESQIGEQGPHAFVGAYGQVRAAPPEMRGEGLQTHLNDLNGESSYQPETYAATENKGIQHEHVQRSVAGDESHDEDRVSGCYITQRLGDVDRSLRRVVDRTPDFSSGFEGAGGQGRMIGEPIQDPGSTNAGLFAYGNHQDHSDAEAAMATQPQIVDDGPWRSFLVIAGDNSNGSASDMDATQYRPILRASKISETEPMYWSQHATGGGQTSPKSSSCISPSLSSITQGSDMDTIPKQAHEHGRPNTSRGKKPRDEDEDLWQKFVFGSKSSAASDLAEEAAVNTAESTSSRRNMPSSLLPGSLAHTTHTNFGFTACISESVQDAAARVPRSTSSGSILPMAAPLDSPFIRRQAQGRSEGNVAQQTAESGSLMDHAVARTSVQNNASEDANGWSTLVDDTRPKTARAGPHHIKGGTIQRYRAAEWRRDEPAFRNNMLVGDEEGSDGLGRIDYR